jgi:hypothetical protein
MTTDDSRRKSIFRHSSLCVCVISLIKEPAITNNTTLIPSNTTNTEDLHKSYSCRYLLSRQSSGQFFRILKTSYNDYRSVANAGNALGIDNDDDSSSVILFTTSISCKNIGCRRQAAATTTNHAILCCCSSFHLFSFLVESKTYPSTTNATERFFITKSSGWCSERGREKANHLCRRKGWSWKGMYYSQYYESSAVRGFDHAFASHNVYTVYIYKWITSIGG